MKKQNIALLAAENITLRRKAMGLTQAQVAEKISVEKESISRMESGRIVLNLERLQQFAELYGCAAGDLLRDSSAEAQSQAQTIRDLIQPLTKDEQDAVVHFVAESVRLFQARGTD